MGMDKNHSSDSEILWASELNIQTESHLSHNTWSSSFFSLLLCPSLSSLFHTTKMVIYAGCVLVSLINKVGRCKSTPVEKVSSSSFRAAHSVFSSLLASSSFLNIFSEHSFLEQFINGRQSPTDNLTPKPFHGKEHEIAHLRSAIKGVFSNINCD